jgi:hypothetical protein
MPETRIPDRAIDLLRMAQNDLRLAALEFEPHAIIHSPQQQAIEAALAKVEGVMRFIGATPLEHFWDDRP